MRALSIKRDASRAAPHGKYRKGVWMWFEHRLHVSSWFKSLSDIGQDNMVRCSYTHGRSMRSRASSPCSCEALNSHNPADRENH